MVWRQKGTERAMAKLIGLVYALSGLVVMWAFWVSFVIFLCEPRRLLGSWPSQPLITGDGCKSRRPRSCSIYVLSPYSRCNTLGWPAPGSRTQSRACRDRSRIAPMCTWPIPLSSWSSFSGNPYRLMSGPPMRLSHRQRCGRYLLPAGPSCSWVPWSFGVRDLLGIQQMQAWINGRGLPAPRLKTGRLYRWFRHPMYISVLLGVWATPRMSVGHLLLADSLPLTF